MLKIFVIKSGAELLSLKVGFMMRHSGLISFDLFISTEISNSILPGPVIIKRWV